MQKADYNANIRSKIRAGELLEELGFLEVFEQDPERFREMLLTLKKQINDLKE